jgi:hypothetical protein
MGRMRLLCLLGALSAAADETVAPPPLKLIRYEEDWSGYGDSSRRAHTWLEPLKHVRIGREGWFLTVGGETRQRYEVFRNPSFGLDPADRGGYYLHRYMMHADAHFGERIRLFGQLKSGIENGRNGGPRVPDEDRLDVHQAFVEVRPWRRIGLRAGRQEVNLGSSRLISIREGPNVRLSFDGVRLSLGSNRWTVDLLAIRPTRTRRGFFDDTPDHRQSLWGMYAASPALELYYLGLDRKYGEFVQGRGREQRHSIGVRWFRKPQPHWDYDYEAVWQFGSFGSAGEASIRAWTVASNTGYTFGAAPGKPRIGLKVDAASGDRNPNDRRLGTFNALFPKGAYFNQADLLGPYNLMDVHPSVTVHVSRSVTITPDADFYWRHSTHDGVYGIPGDLLFPVPRSSIGRDRYIGSNAGVSIEWRASRYCTLESQYLHFYPGPFLKRALLPKSVDFFSIWATIRF